MNLSKNCSWTYQRIVHEPFKELFMNLSKNCSWTYKRIDHEPFKELSMYLSKNCSWTFQRIVHEPIKELFTNLLKNCSQTFWRIVHELSPRHCFYNLQYKHRVKIWYKEHNKCVYLVPYGMPSFLPCSLLCVPDFTMKVDCWWISLVYISIFKVFQRQ